MSLPLMTMADAPGGYGASNRPKMVTSNGSPPHEALVVLHWTMRATLHRRIRMVIKTASKPSVFFFIVNYKLKQYVTISQPIYCFKQNRATSPSVTPLGGLPVSKILHIHLIHAVGGANGSPWWGWLGVVLCFKQRKKMYYSFIVILRSNSFWFPLERT